MLVMRLRDLGEKFSDGENKSGLVLFPHRAPPFQGGIGE
jgi:hypothetical protein